VGGYGPGGRVQLISWTVEGGRRTHSPFTCFFAASLQEFPIASQFLVPHGAGNRGKAGILAAGSFLRVYISAAPGKSTVAPSRQSHHLVFRIRGQKTFKTWRPFELGEGQPVSANGKSSLDAPVTGRMRGRPTQRTRRSFSFSFGGGTKIMDVAERREGKQPETSSRT